LKEPEAVGVILDLFETSDVVLQNFRPEVVDRMGSGFSAARARNSKIVYVVPAPQLGQHSVEVLKGVR